MDVRGKLVELLDEVQETGVNEIPAGFGCTREYIANEKVASHLTDHGVTVHEWIPVKEHLPQENEPEGTLCENVQVLLNNGKVSVGWCNRRTKLWYHMEYDEDYFISKDYDHTPVIAWQPLAQPPKGE